MSDNKGFPGTWLEVWIAPGEYIEIKGAGQITENLGSGERYPRTGRKKIALRLVQWLSKKN